MDQKRTSGLAIAGLVTGIIALVSSFIPLLNVLSFPFVILAIVFGAIGLYQVRKGTKGGKGIAIGGLVCGVLALLVTFAMYGTAASVADSDSSADKPAAPATQPQNADSQDSAPSDAPAAAQPQPESAPEPAAEPEPEPAEYAVTIDDCRISEDYQGNPAAVITFTFTNNSDEARSFMATLNPEVFQDGIELNTVIGAGQDSDKYMSDIKPGATVTVEIAYELESDSDITVEVTKLISFDDTVLAERTFSVN